MARPTADFTFDNHFTIFMVEPGNAEAREHLEEHTDGTWFGGALAVEHRYAASLAESLKADGFTVALR